MASSMPAVLAYLVQRVPILPAVAALRPAFSLGWPVKRADVMVVIAGAPDEEEQASAETTVVDGGGDDHHNVSLTSTILVRRVGKDSMLRAVADAHAILDAIGELVAQDRYLGGAVTTGREARITSHRMALTSRAGQAGEGRTCDLRWVLSWQHRSE